MEIRQIEMFVAAAEEQHFSRAAERCNIVQSGLSTAIRALETELGTSLFIRNTRRVELSAAGEVFLPEARRILSALTAARHALSAVKTGVSGRIVVSMVQSLASLLDLPRILQDFSYANPDVEIHVRETRPGDLTSELKRGSVDVAFMPHYGVSHPGLDVQPLLDAKLVVAASLDHELANKRAVSAGDLLQERFVDVSVRWELRKLVDQVFLSHGMRRKSSFEVEDVAVLLEFVERGLGLAMVPEVFIRDMPIKALDVDLGGAPLPNWGLGMYWASQSGTSTMNPAADLFRDSVRRALQL
ncbi:LysR family transcriptional regulator [Salipiger mangrovisoli]|uniref:LysR family transcriptional regulator n=1 Tax=Salipiger mangrovisoli TaxID=2865933 RepID=A0ABR9X8J3_9RHOB|nr:LysR family transcriptional regulator [Salipiger mangrovisoli]MBE9639811.1 LysR family transcriptional regulator [Salipiger mangrovisoli]